MVWFLSGIVSKNFTADDWDCDMQMVLAREWPSPGTREFPLHQVLAQKTSIRPAEDRQYQGRGVPKYGQMPSA
jgi:hypothetical protein